MTQHAMRLAGRRALVVEDAYQTAMEIKRTLEGAGATIVGPFGRSAEALAALDAGPIDCAVVDINLGRGAEFVLADALQDRGVPFLFLTGYDREVIPERFAGVVRLEKPVDLSRLLLVAADICDSAKVKLT